MPIQQVRLGAGVRRRPPAPGAPQAEVLLGVDDDAPVGLVHVTIPAGGGMPEHAHGPSTVILFPISGEATLIDVADDGRVIRLAPDTATTIPIGRRVRLENDGDTDARILVVVSPPDFARQIAGWQPDGTTE